MMPVSYRPNFCGELFGHVVNIANRDGAGCRIFSNLIVEGRCQNGQAVCQLRARSVHASSANASPLRWKTAVADMLRLKTSKPSSPCDRQLVLVCIKSLGRVSREVVCHYETMPFNGGGAYSRAG